MRRRNNQNNYQQYNYAANRGQPNGYHSQDEIRKVSAKQRYLFSPNWKNQCICLCLEQLIQRIVINGQTRVSLKSQNVITLLQQLAKRHRLYIIHLLPSDVINNLNSDKPYEQSQYELDIINLLHQQSGLPKHKILFCTTQKGKSSMVRQLMPTLYIDS